MPSRKAPKRIKRDESNPLSSRKKIGKKAPEITVETIPDFFDHEDVGGKERWAHDVEMLVTEWAFFFPNHLPYIFLTDCKGYSESQANSILKHFPASQWPTKREAALDKLTEGLIRRHVDKMAEVQETHISASKLGMAQALKMLANGSTEFMKDAEGKPILNKDGTPRFKQFRSIDLVNCMTAIEKAQQVYRRAMGLPNEEGGLNQILAKIEKMQEVRQHHVHLTQNTTTTNVQVNVNEKSPDSLSYDDIMMLIEAKREQKAKLALENTDERLKIEAREGVPTGDFTSGGTKP